MKLPKHVIDAIGADPANCVTPSDETPRLDRAAVKAQRADSNGSKSAWAMLIKRVPPPKRFLTAASPVSFPFLGWRCQRGFTKLDNIALKQPKDKTRTFS